MTSRLNKYAKRERHPMPSVDHTDANRISELPWQIHTKTLRHFTASKRVTQENNVFMVYSAIGVLPN
ncbi:unnamed protein product [Orchesella dallaii]|uniref:Uncharacterized protein n=1 Tax=Orchesella dallaii TaxID=48710 RepID=A0ABP1RUQ1_9HEXA